MKKVTKSLYLDIQKKKKAKLIWLLYNLKYGLQTQRIVLRSRRHLGASQLTKSIDVDLMSAALFHPPLPAQKRDSI